MVAVAAVTQLLGVVQTWLSTQVGQRVMHELRTSVFAHLQRQSLGFFTRTRGGEVQSRLTNDVNGMQGVVTSTATSIASNLTTAVATAVAMVALSWRLSLLSLLVIPPALWLTRKVALLRRAVTAQQQRHLADLNSRSRRASRSAGCDWPRRSAPRPQRRAFATTSHELVDLELRSQLAGRWRMATMQIVFAVIPALVYLAAGLPATSSAMTIGTLVAFTTLQAGIFRPLMGLLNVGAQWVASMALFSRVFEYLDLVPDVPAPAVTRWRSTRHPCGVTCASRASRCATPAPTGMPCRASRCRCPPGSTLALVGPTGSGKSTVAGLLARLHDPDAGRVTVDGVDVRDLDPDVLASVVGVVSQESYLVHASVRDNLLLARPAATEGELWAALAAAQVADLVASLPEGLETVVGARGHRFSGGEQQRLAVARTILRDPPVLVLDEATSALDTATERALQGALDELASGRTTITIAHRLSTVRDADHIAVLDAGRVVESGTHEQLVAANGRYAGLVAATERPRLDQ